MNYTCCYQCEQRTLGCHDNCNNYAHYHELNEAEKAERKKYSQSRFDVSLNRVCEQKLREACK